jgi:homoserine kinase
MSDKAHLQVPCSTSNLGPGFDTLGLALPWYLDAYAERKGPGKTISLKYDGPQSWQKPLKGLVLDALSLWENKSGKRIEGITFSLSGQLPLARGLGSSAVYRVAALSLANIMMGSPLKKNELLALVCGLEHHSDNAVPCMHGGLTVSSWDGNNIKFFRTDVPERFRFVALVPDLELATDKARGVLPEKINRKDAVINMQRSLFLVEAISSDRPELLKKAFSDSLHQPYREKLVPFLYDVIAAAEKKGAYGAFLSGSGSTIISVTNEENAAQVAETMKETLLSSGGRGNYKIMKADNVGTKTIE